MLVPVANPATERRLIELAGTLPATLVNVQSPRPETGRSAEEEGRDLIRKVARRANLAEEEWEAETIGKQAPGTVIIVRGTRYQPRSLTDALIQRLSRLR